MSTTADLVRARRMGDGSRRLPPRPNRRPTAARRARKNYTKTEAGQNHAATFLLVAMLFMPWAVLNSLTDTMDQHFQDLLHPSAAQPAWGQFAHDFGCTLMVRSAGMITRRIGYKGGIIFGLILVSLGCFWFVPALQDGFEETKGVWYLNDRGASRMLSVGFFLFFIGRVIGAAILRKTSAHRALGTYALLNFLLCGLVVAKVGWLSVVAVFGTFFFMAIMFPTIFAVEIFGLGPDSRKKASAFIVMLISGGALMPKLMGRLGDRYNMSFSLLMPLVGCALIACYGFFRSKLSQAPDLLGVDASQGH